MLKDSLYVHTMFSPFNCGPLLGSKLPSNTPLSEYDLDSNENMHYFLNSSPFLNCLQDEMEELRSEMLEMRDMYMEDDVYQLQELRQQLEQVRTSQSLSWLTKGSMSKQASKKRFISHLLLMLLGKTSPRLD